MGQLPRVCVIGAGSSGIATAKSCTSGEIEFDCFELSDRVGGNEADMPFLLPNTPTTQPHQEGQTS